MDKKELLTEMEQLENQLPLRQIGYGKLLYFPFSIGYFYDENNSIWKVYEVDEKGIVNILEKTDSEELALYGAYCTMLIHIP